MKVTTKHTPNLRPATTPEDLAALRKRNEERVKEAIERMGPSWVLYRAEQYQAEVLAEHKSMQVRMYR